MKKLYITLCHNKKGETYYSVCEKDAQGNYNTLGYASHVYEFKDKKKN